MTAAVLVLAKAPVAGLAKTRIAADVGAEAAARLAAAALLDTMSLVESYASSTDRVIALTGELGSAVCGAEIAERLSSWTVIPQRGETLGERLSSAHEDVAALLGADRALVQIGMDTPQLSHADLDALERLVVGPDRHARCALGPATDGGWWGLATSRAGLAQGLAAVEMSTATTGRDTARALVAGGAELRLAHPVTDMDTWADALEIAEVAPQSRLADAVSSIARARRSELAS